MSLKITTLMLLCAGPAVAQLPSAAGVHVEVLPVTLRINGLAVQVTQLRGPGVPALVQATASHWAAAPQTQGPWQQVSRQLATASEVLQWRSTAEGIEALYSRLPLTQVPRITSRLALQLPALCRQLSQIDLGTYAQPVLQVTAQCGGSRAALQSLLPEAALRGGWRAVVAGELPRQWSRPGQTLQMDLVNTASGIALVVLQVGRGALE